MRVCYGVYYNGRVWGQALWQLNFCLVKIVHGNVFVFLSCPHICLTLLGLDVGSGHVNRSVPFWPQVDLIGGVHTHLSTIATDLNLSEEIPELAQIEAGLKNIQVGPHACSSAERVAPSSTSRVCMPEMA